VPGLQVHCRRGGLPFARSAGSDGGRIEVRSCFWKGCGRSSMILVFSSRTERGARTVDAFGRATIRRWPLILTQLYVSSRLSKPPKLLTDLIRSPSRTLAVPAPAQILSQRQPRLPSSALPSDDRRSRQVGLQIHSHNVLHWRKALWRSLERRLPPQGRGCSR
jgi:hypothetical protein